MKYSVNAVVVTCNRCELLKQAIDALLNQTYPLNKIVIINNASTDGTKEYLDNVIDPQGNKRRWRWWILLWNKGGIQRRL